MRAQAPSIRTRNPIPTAHRPVLHPRLIHTAHLPVALGLAHLQRPLQAALANRRAASALPTNPRNNTEVRRPEPVAATVLRLDSPVRSARRPAVATVNRKVATANRKAVTVNRKAATADRPPLTALPVASVLRKISNTAEQWCPWAAAVNAARSAPFAIR